MSLSSLVRASYVKDLDGLLEVWATLFGNVSVSLTRSFVTLLKQFLGIVQLNGSALQPVLGECCRPFVRRRNFGSGKLPAIPIAVYEVAAKSRRHGFASDPG